MKTEPTNQITLTCEVCGKEFLGDPPIICCSGRDCGCMGRPIEPVVCSKECFDKIINKYKNEKQKKNYKTKHHDLERTKRQNWENARGGAGAGSSVLERGETLEARDIGGG